MNEKTIQELSDDVTKTIAAHGKAVAKKIAAAEAEREARENLESATAALQSALFERKG